MSGRWKRLVAILGVTALVVGQNEALVKADELPDDVKETIIAVEDEEIGDSIQESSTEQKPTDSSEETKSSEESSTEQKPTDSSEETKSSEESSTEQESTEGSEENKSNEEETTDGFEEEIPTVETTVEMTTEEITVAEEYGIMLLAEDETNLAMATELGWSSETPGVAKFKHNLEKDGNWYSGDYYYEIYRDGEKLNGPSSWGISSGAEYFEMDFTIHNDWFKESGVYTYKIKTVADSSESYDFGEGCVSELSAEFDYTYPGIQLDIPSNVHWSDTQTGLLEWDSVEGTKSYEVKLSKNGSSWNSTTVTGTSWDCSRYLIEDTEYIVKIRALSPNIEEIYHSEQGSVTLDVSNSNDNVESNVNDMISDLDSSSTEEEVKSVIADITETYSGNKKADLQIAMQSDEETQNAIANLETMYKEKSNVTVSKDGIAEDTGIDKEKVSIVGAALNAEPGTNVEFSISKPTEEDMMSYNKSLYKNAIQFSMNLDGVKDSTNLDIPVTITIPIPEGIDPIRLVIIHEAQDGTQESVVKKINNDGTVSFTITHFSEFLFAEEIPAADEKPSGDSGNGSGNSSSSNDSHSSNSSSVVAVRPKEKAPTIGNSEGWNAIAKEVDKAIVNAATGEEAVVWVKLNDAKEIPESALKAIAGKNVVVCFVTNTGFIINVSGASLDVNSIGKVSFSSTTDKEGNVILKIRNSVTDINKSVAIFAKATANLTTEETLYFVDADSTLIPFGTSGVAENGYVAFSVPFVNANYVIK